MNDLRDVSNKIRKCQIKTLGMKDWGQLVTLSSIPTTCNAFSPPTLQHPSTSLPTKFVLQIIFHTIGYLYPTIK
jgi:hypothetical protein